MQVLKEEKHKWQPGNILGEEFNRNSGHLKLELKIK